MTATTVARSASVSRAIVFVASAPTISPDCDLHQVVKEPMLAYGADVMNRLRQSFVASEFNLPQLLVEISAVSALHGVGEPAQVAKKK